MSRVDASDTVQEAPRAGVDLDALEAMRKLATPGWHANPVNPYSVTSSQSHPIWTLSDDFHRQCMHGVGQDREYLLALYNAAPALIAASREAERSDASDGGTEAGRAEPVAWRVRLCAEDGFVGDWRTTTAKPELGRNGAVWREIEPLYLHPAPTRPVADGGEGWVLMRNDRPHTIFGTGEEAWAECKRQREADIEWRRENAHMADVRVFWNLYSAPAPPHDPQTASEGSRDAPTQQTKEASQELAEGGKSR